MRYLMTFSYDGTNYNGFQKQPDGNTIQNKIEDVLSKINGNNYVNIVATGRTDAHVHAYNQKAHFDLDNVLDCERLKKSLNGLLPADIYVKKIEEVSNDFHARFNVKSKEYIYKINVGEYNPLEKDYVYQYNNTLDTEKVIEASKFLIGEHNFKSFTKSDIEREDYVRTIYDIKVLTDEQYIIIKFIGNGFLRYMVRNLVGILIEVGSGKKTVSDVKIILDSMDRTKAGITAPANGLYLNDIFY